MEPSGDIIALRRIVASLASTFDYTSKELDARKLKEIKNIVKRNAAVIPELVTLLFDYVRRENCDRRLAIVLICDQLFHRSHAFRVELANIFQEFSVYTLESDPLHFPLPLPKEAAKSLKIESLKIVRVWHEKFSAAYPKLSNAYRFLRSSKAFDFERADAQLQVERVREEEAAKRAEEKSRRVVEEVKKEFCETFDDVTRCLNEVQTAIQLLLPRFEAEDDDQPGPSNANLSKNSMHAYNNEGTISIVVPLVAPVVEINEANEPVVNTLLDCVKMLHYFNKLLVKWLGKLTKFGGRCGAEILKQILDLKSRVSIELQRCEELNLPSQIKRANRNSDSDSDEFEDVPDKDGLELDFKPPDDFIAPHEFERIRQLESGSCSIRGNLETRNPEGGECSHSQGLSVPILSYGLDLKYWGDNKVEPAEVPRNNSDCHRFWRSSDQSDTTVSDGIEVYKARLMTFVGTEKLRSRQCRAPLSDGTLCPRHDKLKCPIHGTIVDRDIMGFPCVQLSGESNSSVTTIGGDQEYMKDLEAAVGVKLREEASGSKKMRKKERGTVKKREISEASQVRKRLCAKLLNSRSIKRVSEALDAIQKARAAKNFEHQFNYALSRK